MRRLLLLIPLLFLIPRPAAAQIGSYQNWCQAGGTFAVTSGISSSNPVQTSYPLCQVTVFVTGTVTPATIYSTLTQTPLTNPFCANLDGSFLFFASQAQQYDVVMSNSLACNPLSSGYAQLPATFTFFDAAVSGTGSGGGGGGGPSLFTNGIINGVQTTLNIAQGTGIGVSNSLGTTTFVNSGLLNVASGSGLSNSSGVVSLLTSCAANQILAWNGISWACSTPATGTITGVTTASTSGLTGGGTSGTLALSLLNTCATNQTLAWNGSSWVCTTLTNGTITGATTSGGLFVTGTTLGLLTTCSTNQVLQWNGSAWVCVNVGVGTITGVNTNAGSGLTGGGTSGTLTMSLLTSCATNQVLSWNGSAWVCSAVGTGNVNTNPGAVNQNIIQSVTGGVTTVFSANNFDGIRYANQYNWLQSPPDNLTVAGGNTATLTPCPIGIDVSASAIFPFYVYIATQGTPEPVVVTGGTCSSGALTGTITFVTLNTHAAGWTVQSATSGAAEAGVDADAVAAPSSNQKIVLQPAAAAANNTNPFIFYAPWFVRCGQCVIDGGGAVIGADHKRAAIILNNPNNANVMIRDIRFDPMLNLTGATITNTVCTAGTATISATNTFAVGDVVDIEFTSTSFYWGLHTVTAASGSQFQFASAGCSQATQATGGQVSWEYAFVEDNGFKVVLDGISLSSGGAPFNGAINNGIVALGDQDLMITHLSGMVGHCAADYCGQAVYAPGGFGPNPAIVKISQSDLTLNCTGNGVTSYSGNTLSVVDTVIQGYSMWATNYSLVKGGFGGAEYHNVYQEKGGCSNPIYPGVFAGSIETGAPLLWTGGEGPVGAAPVFSTGGATTYYYYLIVNDSVNGQSAPLPFGACTPSGTTCSLAWPRAIDQNTTTYTVLRSTDSLNAPTAALCVGGSTSACGSVVVAQGQCTTLQCTFSDSVSSNTTAYAVLTPGGSGSGIGGATNNPTFAIFGGNFVLQNSAWLNYQGGNINSNAISSGGGTVAMNGLGPVFTDAFPAKLRTYLRVESMKADGSFTGSTAWLFYEPYQSGGVPAYSKGKILFTSPLTGVGGGAFNTGMNWITLADCISQQTLAANNPRITATACDTGIGTDITSSTTLPANVNLSFTNPNAISFYINSLMDGVSFLERLTAAGKTFKVPVTAPQYCIALSCITAWPISTGLINSIQTANGSGGFAGITAPTTPATVFQACGYTPNGSASGAVVCGLPGLLGRVVSSSTDTIGNGTGTGSAPGGATDCSPYQIVPTFSGVVAEALPTATSLGVPACAFTYVIPPNSSTTSATFTPTSWTINGLSTFVLYNGQQARFSVNPASSADWLVTANDIAAGQRVADTIISITSGTLSSNTCSASATTLTMAGLTPAMVTIPNFSTDPSGITGWGATGGMVIDTWPSAANTLSYKLCNATASSITYGAIVFNVGAR